jgi:hypothetical protein
MPLEDCTQFLDPEGEFSRPFSAKGIMNSSFRQVFWLPDRPTLPPSHPRIVGSGLGISSPVTAAGPLPIFTGFPSPER